MEMGTPRCPARSCCFFVHVKRNYISLIKMDVSTAVTAENVQAVAASVFFMPWRHLFLLHSEYHTYDFYVREKQRVVRKHQHTAVSQEI